MCIHKGIKLIFESNLSQYALDVVLTSMRRRFNVMDVVWTSKRRRVLTGIYGGKRSIHLAR